MSGFDPEVSMSTSWPSSSTATTRLPIPSSGLYASSNMPSASSPRPPLASPRIRASIWPTCSIWRMR